MRTLLAIGRTCLRQTTIPRIRPLPQYRSIQSASRQSYRNGGGRAGLAGGGGELGGGRGEGRWGGGRKWQFKSPPRRNGLLLGSAVGLSPAAFVVLSQKENGGTEMTAEARMLEASREEISKKVGDDVHGLQRISDSMVYYLDTYLWEPLCTSLRFLHLVVIFVPVIVTVPAAYFGSRDQTRDNERAGTLWWYGFLVNAMERAGPAFIKVWHPNNSTYGLADSVAWAMGCF